MRATVKGSLLVAMAQGALGGLIFWMLDIRAAVLWGVVMTLLSLIRASSGWRTICCGPFWWGATPSCLTFWYCCPRWAAS